MNGNHARTCIIKSDTSMKTGRPKEPNNIMISVENEIELLCLTMTSERKTTEQK